ncbi:MAG: metallophosphoesterase [Acidimicrobiia bacterium]
MRLALFADLHLDVPFQWAPSDVARRRRQALRDTLDSIIDVAQEEGVDALCCAGDLYEHDRVAPDTAAVLQSAFARLSHVPVLVAPGNHDWFGPKSVYARTEWTPNVHIYTEARLQAYELTAGLTIWGAAHRQPAGTPNFLDGFTVDRDANGIHMALFHGSLRSGLPFEEDGKQPHAPFDAEQIPQAGLHHALVGHFHTPRDGEWHTYPGNPDPLTFGEEGERGLVIIDVHDDGTVTRTRHRVAQSVVADVTVDVTGCSSTQEIRNRAQAELASRSGIVRVTLHGEVAPDVDVTLACLDGVGEHLDATVPRLGEITVAYDLDAIAGESTVRGQFVADVRASSLDSEMKRRILITGLRALEGRHDLGVD